MRRILLSLTTAIVVGIGLVGAAPARASWAPHGGPLYARAGWRGNEWRERQEWAWRHHLWRQWHEHQGYNGYPGRWSR